MDTTVLNRIVIDYQHSPLNFVFHTNISTLHLYTLSTPQHSP